MFADPLGGTAWSHPARIDEQAAALALTGRVPADERPALARALVRGLAAARADQVVYYRHPDGGAWLFGVSLGTLRVVPYGLRAAAGERPVDVELAEVAGQSPQKRLVLGEPGQLADGQAAALEIESAFAVAQFVFVDGRFVGAVEPGATKLFLLAPGKVRVRVADAADGELNPAEDEVDLAAGRLVRLSVMPAFR